jgi:aryl-alcohol dehydrogenase-like predicted oxidoreductase
MSETHHLLDGITPLNRMGFGAMRLCDQPGNFGPYPDWEQGIQLLQKAASLGAGLIDTAHAYGPGWNEVLVGDAFAHSPTRPLIATKGGVEKTAPDRILPDGRPATLKRRCKESLRWLRIPQIDLYQLHRPDPAVPLEESVGALKELQDEGLIRHIGLSNVSTEQLDQARAIARIASVQNRYNILEPADDALIDHCNTLGIAFLPWGPLAAKPFAKEAPLASHPHLASLANSLQTSPAVLALAWLLHRSPNIILIPGTTSPKHLEENFSATKIQLSHEQFTSLSDSLKSA